DHWKRIRNQWLAYKRKVYTKSGQEAGSLPFFRHERSMRFCEDPVETEGLNCTISNITGLGDAVTVSGSSDSLDDEREADTYRYETEIPVPSSRTESPVPHCKSTK
ncbi:unnamed protein product, partial [Allacma fusca]